MSITLYVHLNEEINHAFDVEKFNEDINTKYPGTNIEVSTTARTFDICWENYSKPYQFELKIDKAKKIEQELFTNIDNAINWYYKFYPAKTDEEKDGLLTVEFKRNKTKKAIQELIKRIENKSTIEEARIILEDFNFTLPENKTKKSYIT